MDKKKLVSYYSRQFIMIILLNATIINVVKRIFFFLQRLILICVDNTRTRHFMRLFADIFQKTNQILLTFVRR